jgi:hypothetical protein
MQVGQFGKQVQVPFCDFMLSRLVPAAQSNVSLPLVGSSLSCAAAYCEALSRAAAAALLQGASGAMEADIPAPGQSQVLNEPHCLAWLKYCRQQHKLEGLTLLHILASIATPEQFGKCAPRSQHSAR